jgi:hypothetical protein
MPPRLGSPPMAFEFLGVLRACGCVSAIIQRLGQNCVAQQRIFRLDGLAPHRHHYRRALSWSCMRLLALINLF